MRAFKHTDGPFGFSNGLAFEICPHCKQSDGGLIYGNNLKYPVNCETCYLAKTGKRWNPYFDEEYLAKVRQDALDWKQFIVESGERSARWKHERELLLEGMKNE